MPTFSRISSFFLFPIVIAALVLAEYWIARTADFAAHPDVLAFAVTVDIVVGIPLLGYLFLVRTRRAPTTIIALLFLLSIGLAHLILPESGKQYLRIIELVLPLLEIALLIYAISRIQKVVQAYREIRPTTVYMSDAVEQSLQNVLGNVPAVGIIVTELSLIYYAIGGWFSNFHASHPSHHPYRYHIKSGYGVIAALVIGLSLIEIPLVHLVVHQFNPIAAWILTILSLYTVGWLIGDYQAIRLHPIVVTHDTLHLRTGMRWRVHIPFRHIAAIRPLHHSERQNKAFLDLSVAKNPRLLLELNEPVPVRGLFGIKRTTDKIAFAVDEEKAFLTELQSLLPTP